MSYKVRDYLVAAGIFLSIGLYKFWWVLTLPNEGLSNAGDGLGSLTVYAALRELLQEHAYFDYFLSDQLHLKDVAQGQMPSIVPPGTLWRFLMLPVLASKIDVNNVYDLWGLVTFFLNAMCGFFLHGPSKHLFGWRWSRVSSWLEWIIFPLESRLMAT